MTDEGERVTVETIPLTDEQILEAKIATVLDAVKDLEVQIEGFRHVLRLMGDKLHPVRERLERMCEALKESTP